MPKYSYDCEVHGGFEVAVPISRHQDHPPCPSEGCAEITLQTYAPERPKDWNIPAVVVHVGAGGAVRFPMHMDAPVPAGFNRVELKTISEVESFERTYNQRLSSEAEQHQEHEARHFASMTGKNRSDLRTRMQSMSQFGQDFARFVMDANDKRTRRRGAPNFHVEILHYDRSNREAQRDEHTGWKRKYF